MSDEVPELEFSPLGRSVTEDGITVQIHIYRPVGSTGGWALEVVDHEGASTVWDEYFSTDQEALQEFSRTVDENGIGGFLDEPDETLH